MSVFSAYEGINSRLRFLFLSLSFAFGDAHRSRSSSAVLIFALIKRFPCTSAASSRPLGFDTVQTIWLQTFEAFRDGPGPIGLAQVHAASLAYLGQTYPLELFHSLQSQHLFLRIVATLTVLHRVQILIQLEV